MQRERKVTCGDRERKYGKTTERLRYALRRGALAVGVAVATASPLAAQWVLDQGFGDGGFRTLTEGDTVTAPMMYLMPRPGGAVLAMLPMSSSIIALEPDGTMSPSWNNGAALDMGLDTIAWEVGVMDACADHHGRVFVLFPRSSDGAWGVKCFLPDGAVDESFGVQGIANAFPPDIPVGSPTVPQAIICQSDGKVIVVGMYDIFVRKVVRLLPNGALDTSYGNGGVADLPQYLPNELTLTIHHAVQRLCVEPGTDALFVFGLDQEGWDPLVTGVARVLADGTPDLAFGTNGRVTVPFSGAPLLLGEAPYAAVALGDGRIALAGLVLELDPVTNEFISDALIGQLRPDGSPDPDFGTNGFVRFRTTADASSGEVFTGMHRLEDGSLLVTGYAVTQADDHRHPLIARFSPTGELMPAFSTDGWEICPYTEGAFSVTSIMSGNGLVLAGTDDIASNYWFARYAETGTGTDGPAADVTSTPLSCYPNPAHGACHLVWAGEQGMASIELLDALGRVVSREHRFVRTGERMQLELTRVPPGVYQVVMDLGATRAAQRVVVE